MTGTPTRTPTSLPTDTPTETGTATPTPTITFTPLPYATVAMVTMNSITSTATGGSAVNGKQLTTTCSMRIVGLGYYDHGGNGLTASHDVGIIDLSGNILISATIPAGMGSELIGAFRFIRFPEVELPAGTYFVGGVQTSGDAIISSGQRTFASNISFQQVYRSAIGASTLALPPSTTTTQVWATNFIEALDCATPTSTPAFTPSTTPTPSNTPTGTPTPTPTDTPTNSPTSTPTFAVGFTGWSMDCDFFESPTQCDLSDLGPMDGFVFDVENHGKYVTALGFMVPDYAHLQMTNGVVFTIWRETTHESVVSASATITGSLPLPPGQFFAQGNFWITVPATYLKPDRYVITAYSEDGFYFGHNVDLAGATADILPYKFEALSDGLVDPGVYPTLYIGYYSYQGDQGNRTDETDG